MAFLKSTSLKIAGALAAVVTLLAGAELKTGSGVVTHEWGTFTSVVQEDGSPIEWAPLLGPPDLPCFVARSQQVYKAELRGLVRMETPVLYFYASRPQTLSVRVDFPQGLITEWFPSPDGFGGGSNFIDWKHVEVAPGSDPAYPASAGPSHYYAARNTDASPLRVGDQQEKMLFYRGLGYFQPPLRARYINDQKLGIRNTGDQPIPFVIAFESRDGKIGFRIAENVSGSITMDAPQPDQDLAAIRQTLTARLTGLGLYPKEAAAMVDTWSDSWFTDGARIFYIMPRATVDALLPLKIEPAPAEIQRVFVGRLDLLSPWTKDRIEHALRAGDEETLNGFGRFLEPFLAQIQRADKEFVLSPEVQKYARAIANGKLVEGNGYGAPAPDPAACVE